MDEKEKLYLKDIKEEFSVLTDSQKKTRLDQKQDLEKEREKDEEKREKIKELRKKIENDIKKEEEDLTLIKSKVDVGYENLILDIKKEDKEANKEYQKQKLDDLEKELAKLKAAQKSYDSNFDKTLLYSSWEAEESDLIKRYKNYEALEETILKQKEIIKLKSSEFNADNLSDTDINKSIEINKLETELKKIEKKKSLIKKDLDSGKSLSQRAEELLYSNKFAKNFAKSASVAEKMVYENGIVKKYGEKANKKDELLYSNKYAKKYSDFLSKIDKVFYENSVSQKVGKTLNKASIEKNKIIKKAGSSIKRGLKAAIAKIKHFLFMTWSGRFVLTFIIGFFALATSITPQTSQVAEEISLADSMMTAWIDVIEDSAAEFYDKYHQNIPASEIIPIIYTYIDEDRLNEVFGSEKSKYNMSDYSLKQDYYMAVSRSAVDEFLKGMDMLSVRELFLDEVKFETEYLNYIWSDWITVGSVNDEINLDNDSLDAYSSRLFDEAGKHSAYKAYTSTVKTRKTVDDYSFVDRCFDELQLINGKYETVNVCSPSYEKIGSHIEHGVANVKRYDYKNLISTEWVANKSLLDDADKWNDDCASSWLIDNPAKEDEFDSIVGMPWEFIALVNGDSGYTYKETHFWTLREAFAESLDHETKEITGEMDNTVYHDIVYEYNPNTNKADYLFCKEANHNHTTHIGHTLTGSNGEKYTDVITLSKKVDISGTINGDKYKHEIPIELNRNIIYSYYYKLSEESKPNEFTEMYLSKWYKRMILWAHTYADIMESYIGNPTMLIDMLDGEYYDSIAAQVIWAQIKSDVLNAQKLGHKIGGFDRQCTQYANWRLYKEYGIYNNYGHGKDTATHAIENSNLTGNQNLVYSKDPKPGSMFSYRSEPYGHTGWVEDFYEENSEWYIVISDGNVNHGGIRLNAKYKYSDWQAKWGTAIYYAVPAN